METGKSFGKTVRHLFLWNRKNQAYKQTVTLWRCAGRWGRTISLSTAGREPWERGRWVTVFKQPFCEIQGRTNKSWLEDFWVATRDELKSDSPSGHAFVTSCKELPGIHQVRLSNRVKSPEMQKRRKRAHHIKVWGASSQVPCYRRGWLQGPQPVWIQGTPPGLMCCCQHFELNNFLPRSAAVSFCTGSHKSYGLFCFRARTTDSLRALT